MMTEKAVISAQHLCIGYRTGHTVKRVHNNLSFSLFKGELTCLLGANGCGKSTLLRTLSASQPSLAGELRVMGTPIGNLSEKQRSRTIGIVLTDKTMAGGLSVEDLVALGRQPHTGFFGRLNKHDHEVIDQALESVGIAHKAKSYTAELSDGERQKVMIAKALVQECPIILLDEPTAFLDVVSRIEIMNLLHRLAVEQDKAILLSTHDIEQALVLSDRLWLLSKGIGLSCGVTEDVILSHQMDSLFAHTDIRFDYDHGVYYPMVKGSKEVTVSASDETLLHWTINALCRNGFNCITTTSHDVPHVTVKSPTEITLNHNSVAHSLNSFEQLLDMLK